MTPRPPMPGETPLSESEAIYLRRAYELPAIHDSLPIEICRNNDSNWQDRRGLRQLAVKQMGQGSTAAGEFGGFSQAGNGTQTAGEGVASE